MALAISPALATAQRPAGRALQELRAGTIITRSTKFRPGTYRLPAPADTDSAIMVIRGDSLTIDLTGVILEGTAVGSDPDVAKGVAIRIEGGSHIRIVGARAFTRSW